MTVIKRVIAPKEIYISKLINLISINAKAVAITPKKIYVDTTIESFSDIEFIKVDQLWIARIIAIKTILILHSALQKVI